MEIMAKRIGVSDELLRQALPLLEIEKELAKRRKGFRTDIHDIPPNLGERGEATEIVAKR